MSDLTAGSSKSVSVVVTVKDIPPTVISTSPANGATGVATNSTINASFSKNIDSSTVTASTFAVTMGTGGVSVPGALSASGSTVIFTPTSSLSNGTTYTAKVTTGIKDSLGTALASNYTWSFTTASSQASGWVKTVVDSSNVGWGVRIKLDSNGLPGISYFNNHSSVKGAVNFAKSNGSTWVLENNIYTSTYNGGGGTSLAFDSNSQPRLVFSDYPSNHSYAEKNGSTWSFQTFSCLSDYSGSDIVVDSSNNSHIAWYTNSTLEYRVWNGSTWQTQTIDASGDMGYAPQMVMDNSGHVYIAYGQWVNGSPHILKFAYFNGSSWSTESVASTYNAGQSHPIALTSQGYPTILYSDVNGNYKLATKVNGSWQFQNTPVTCPTGANIGFAIDANDYIHIVSHQQVNGIWYLTYFFYDGSTWTSTNIDQFSLYTGGSYPGADLTIGNDGTIHVAYANPDTWSVIYAKLGTTFPQLAIQVYPNNPVLTYSGTGWYQGSQFDASRVGSPLVVKVGGVYYMYYSGLPYFNNFQVGLATSTDGIQWVKSPSNPVIRNNTQSWCAFDETPEFGFYENNLFKLWFEGTPANLSQLHNVGYAFSSDGINWTLYSGNPLLSASTWDLIGVVKLANTYYMYYGINGGIGNNTLYVATSNDGINFNTGVDISNDTMYLGLIQVLSYQETEFVFSVWNSSSGQYYGISKDGIHFVYSNMPVSFSNSSVGNNLSTLLIENGVMKFWWGVGVGNITWGYGNSDIYYGTAPELDWGTLLSNIP